MYIRQILNSQNQLTQRGKFFWNMLIPDIVWKNAWLRPYKYCIPNKVKEVHFNILHEIYPCNSMISKFVAVDICVFCEKEGENLSHLFFECKFVFEFWENLAKYLFTIMNTAYIFYIKYILCYYCNDNKTTEIIVIFLILVAKYFIHKQKFQNCIPKLQIFLIEFN